MTQVNTADLIAPALDWAVQQCEGARKDIDFVWWTDDHYSPSTKWAYGGPIIEREEITVERLYAEGCWSAWTPAPEQPRDATAEATTPLIAAMRCYVTSKLGDTVDIPEELMP